MPAQTDIVFELLGLCETLLINIEQQLLYYRASVYKDETARSVDVEITRLQSVLAMFNSEALLEPLADYHALQTHQLKLSPGECSFSRRVAHLVVTTRQQLRLYRPASQPKVDFNRQIQQNRQQLLALCRQGTRQWSFFQSLRAPSEKEAAARRQSC